MIKTCPFDVTEENACKDDVCQSCKFRKVKGEDIVCTWDYLGLQKFIEGKT